LGGMSILARHQYRAIAPSAKRKAGLTPLFSAA
jgi:hypothetical protein